MIFYGTKEQVVGKSDTQRQFCPLCQNKSVQVVHFKTYFHLYFIPVFPFKSRTAVGCHSCGVMSKDISSEPSPLNNLASGVAAPKAPFYMFSGIGVVGLVVLIAIFVSNRPKTYDTVKGDKMQAKGEWEGNLQHGAWEYYFDDGGKKADYNFSYGEFDGQQKTYYQSGGLESEFGMKKGLMHGPKISYTEDGIKTSETNYEDGREHGSFKYFNRDGQVLEEGMSKLDWKDGIWLNYHDNGKLSSKGKYVRSEYDSIWEFYNEEGELVEQFDYENGKLKKVIFVKGPGTQPQVKNGNGEIIEYHDNDQPSSVMEVKNYKYTGNWKEFHEDGKLKSEGTFDADGEKIVNTYITEEGLKLVKEGNGLFKEEFVPGLKLVEGQYKNGLKDGLWTYYYPTGTVMVNMEYKAGKQHGKHEVFGMNGNLAGLSTWEDGVRTGPSKSFFDDGTVEISGQYQNNLRAGSFSLYNTNGKVLMKEFYENGDLKERKREGLLD